MAKYRGKDRYMGAWSYTFLNILYCIPLVGLICLVIHSFDTNNENRMHYARSFFTSLLLVLIIGGIITLIVLFVPGVQEAVSGLELSELITQLSTLPPQ